MEQLIGRHEEVGYLSAALSSGRAEFVAVYGRRRVGKTFLVRQVFQPHMAFQLTGLANANAGQQLTNFSVAFKAVAPQPQPVAPANWFEAFGWLQALVAQQPGSGPVVVFLDELPWLDTPRAGFVGALEHFWNSYGSANPRLKLVTCGSAASWMFQKLINNRGGLHNRVTKRIHLQPFTLAEVELFFRHNRVNLDRYQVVQLYSVLGGIPFYLNEVEPGRSAAQIIDRLCFTPGGLLQTEYQNLYRSLFVRADTHMAVVEALSRKGMGLTRDEIINAANVPNGGQLSRVLDELELSGFIRQYTPLGRISRNSLYQLTDPFTLFHLRFMHNAKAQGAGTWLNLLDSSRWRAWSGYAFEMVCLLHVEALKRALGISGIYTEVSSWRSQKSSPGAQIDLLIDRKDNVITVCEMKFAAGVFTITKAYAQSLQTKLQVFRKETGTRKSVFLALVTPHGIEPNAHALGLVQNSLTLDALFA
jgi:uncharacterized protein